MLSLLVTRMCGGGDVLLRLCVSASALCVVADVYTRYGTMALVAFLVVFCVMRGRYICTEWKYEDSSSLVLRRAVRSILRTG